MLVAPSEVAAQIDQQDSKYHLFSLFQIPFKLLPFVGLKNVKGVHRLCESQVSSG